MIDFGSFRIAPPLGGIEVETISIRMLDRMPDVIRASSPFTAKNATFLSNLDTLVT